MNDAKIINDILNLKYLSQEDKQRLLKYESTTSFPEYCTNNLSFTSNKSKLNTFGDYNYLETEKQCEIFYIPHCQVFVDKDKCILMYSTYKLENIYQFIINIDTIIEEIKYIDLSNSLDIGSSFIACEKWFISYGHFKDEMFTLYDFMQRYNKTNISNYKPLIEYPVTQEECQYYRIPQNNHNYAKIEELLFKKTLFNFKSNVTSYKLSDLILLKHDYNSSTFLKFPRNARNHILSQIDTRDNGANKNIFLTRSIGLHIRRIVDNLDDLNNYFKQRNYHVINPENIEYTKLINHLLYAKNIFLTWGGAMVLLMYVNPTANIYILKGKSYEHEHIDLFKNMISHHSLYKITVIDHVNNVININDIEKYIC